MAIDRSQRVFFDEVADLYDEVRPGYPPALIASVISLSGILPTGRILEVGCGPGNATVAFARRGYRMVCLELGPRLAALAARNCRAFPLVQVHNVSFEQWELEERSYDLLISAEAFHWIPPEIGYPRAARCLKDSGSIALFWIVDQDTDSDFYGAIDEVYHREAPNIENPIRSVTPEWLTKQIVGNIRASGCFREPEVEEFAWSESYTTEQYLKLARTFSAHLRIDEDAASRLYSGIEAVIQRFGGQVTRACLAVLFHARVRR